MGRPPSNKLQVTKGKPHTPPPGYEEEDYWKCPHCGHKYTKQKGSFISTQSPVYVHNNGYTVICMPCVKELFVDYTKKYHGDEDMAMERICALLDAPVYEDQWENCRFNGTGEERMAAYLSKTSTKKSKDVTYSDSFIRLRNERSTEEEEEGEESESKTKSKQRKEAEAVRRFGAGFSPNEYKFLMSEYADWAKRYGDPVDKMHEEMYTTLCLLKLNLQSGIINSSNSVSALAKNYKDYMESTISLIEQRRKELEPEVRHDPLGVMIRDIEAYTPAEFYRDKKLYNDEDNMGEYLERFVLRPMQNLLTGTRVMDEEFSITEYQSDGTK